MEYQACKKLPNLLKKCRRIRGFNQKQVAAILGLRSASRISRWEKGSCIPSLVNAIRLSLLYRTMVDGLFSDLVRAMCEEIHRREDQVLRVVSSKGDDD